MKTDVDAATTLDGLRAAAEPLRWRILTLLGEEELCVCHLVETLDAPQSLISHHLRVLRDAGLVESERFRYWTYYRLRPGAVRELGERLLGMAGQAPIPGAARRPCC
ncbi:MAG TPA: metalloregulator ArsR/SmtB family transcription factor [Acidimicrobiia bacterium]|jgi:ArsR family transcriptional regulator|nr:metalloregulator ArsR/SmtB family transcription factor [Acidimicrobiia bacterium]